jgi:uncharacterized protein with GYD domain
MARKGACVGCSRLRSNAKITPRQLTDAGIKAAKDSPRRLDAAKKLLADMGGEMKQFYMVMGDSDFVGICEAPDDAVMARYALQLGGLGFVRTKTLKAFPSPLTAKSFARWANQRSEPGLERTAHG